MVHAEEISGHLGVRYLDFEVFCGLNESRVHLEDFWFFRFSSKIALWKHFLRLPKAILET